MAVITALGMDELNGPQQLMACALAAARRAAVYQTRKQRICPNMGWAVVGQDFCLVSDIFAIAAELEDPNA